MNQNVVLEELEKEITEAKKTSGQDDNFEIEVTDDSGSPEEKQQAVKEDSEEEYSGKVQKRIKKLVDQRREAEIQSRQFQEETAQLKSRLERLEQGNQHQAESQFNTRYKQTRAALSKAVEEGDTEAQVSFSEQLTDMRAAMRVAEMQKQMSSQKKESSPAQNPAQNPAPKKAMDWWEKNSWFNSRGFDRETTAARAIDVQLDLEGFDKDSEDYYDQLDFRLRNVFPELNSGKVQGKPRAKSRAPVAPTAGGSGSPRTNGRTRMTQEQLRMARELGITDEKGLKAYAAEIQKQARS